jgi:hypothetical protein
MMSGSQDRTNRGMSQAGSNTPPRPPAQLWGLWTVDDYHPEGFWLNHIHGRNTDHTPMTFISRDDALATAEDERVSFGPETKITVALIGVAPPEGN